MLIHGEDCVPVLVQSQLVACLDLKGWWGLKWGTGPTRPHCRYTTSLSHMSDSMQWFGSMDCHLCVHDVNSTELMAFVACVNLLLWTRSLVFVQLELVMLLAG